MNLRTLVGLSLAANVALAALVWSPRAPAPSPTKTIPLARDHAAPLAAPAETRVAMNRAEAFDWSRLAAPDLKQYRDRLRAAGCPEQTVRDIITAEINEQFRVIRRAVLDDLERRFWDILAHTRRVFNEDSFTEPLEKLNDERDALIASVLGDNPEQKPKNDERWARRMESRYAWLPAAKSAQLIALEKGFREREIALGKEIQARVDTTETEADRSRRKAINDELAAARKQLLTPEELAEYELRSSSASRWARNLSGFEPTETEWRAVAKARQDYDQLMNAGYHVEAEPAKTALEQQIQATLGAERYAQYQLASDSDYSQTRRVTQRYGLADSVAAQARQVQRDAQAAADRLRQDTTLAPTARQDALTAIREAAQQSLGTLLGETVFHTYEVHSGSWLNQLNGPPPGN
jgi:hypothetical protein